MAAAKFPQQIFAFFEGDGKIYYRTSLSDALTAGGREVGVYILQRTRRGKLVAEWDAEPAPETAPPQPIREEIH